MKERPILFSAPMVRAILDGRKTQTRRILKNQPKKGSAIHFSAWEYGVTAYKKGEFGAYREGTPSGGWGLESIHASPYGQIGDRLWVRETWGQTPDGAGIVYKADGTLLPIQSDPSIRGMFARQSNPNDQPEKFKPSIHMPRWASRITLEITDVRVERLNDISDRDCQREGVEVNLETSVPICHIEGQHEHGFLQGTFALLWESIKGSASWSANPWVWVIEFKRATK